MPLPSITLVMPSFNQALFLEEAIRSVLQQNYPKLEFGIVDGGSTDGSVTLIERYRDRLAFAIVEPDQGQSDAINKGFAHSSGRILGWLNSDDTLLPDALHTVGRLFQQRPDCQWLIGSAQRIDENSRPLGSLHPTGIFTPAGALLRDVPFNVPQPATFFTRKLWDQAGPLSTQLHHAMDFDLWVRFMLTGVQANLLAEELATYREHPDSKSCAQANQFIAALIQIETHYLPSLTRVQRRTLRQRIAYQRRTLAIREGRSALLAQVLRRPWWLLSEEIRQGLRQSAA